MDYRSSSVSGTNRDIGCKQVRNSVKNTPILAYYGRAISRCIPESNISKQNPRPLSSHPAPATTQRESTLHRPCSAQGKIIVQYPYPQITVGRGPLCQFTATKGGQRGCQHASFFCYFHYFRTASIPSQSSPSVGPRFIRLLNSPRCSFCCYLRLRPFISPAAPPTLSLACSALSHFLPSIYRYEVSPFACLSSLVCPTPRPMLQNVSAFSLPF